MVLVVYGLSVGFVYQLGQEGLNKDVQMGLHEGSLIWRVNGPSLHEEFQVSHLEGWIISVRNMSLV